MKIQVIFYSMYGHVYHMAEAIAEGAKQVPGSGRRDLPGRGTCPGCGPRAYRGQRQHAQAFAHIPVVEPSVMAEADRRYSERRRDSATWLRR